MDLSPEKIQTMDAGELVDAVLESFTAAPADRIKIQTLLQIRADEIGTASRIDKMLERLNEQEDDQKAAQRKALAQKREIVLDTDKNGKVMITVENFLKVMQQDRRFENIKYNVLLNAAEVEEQDGPRRWTDADEAESKRYIEDTYKLYSSVKHGEAMRLLWQEREYNPIVNIIDAVEWDGEPRIERFLVEWGKADNTAYVREVSRLIFAGGIHRLYNPGCKFDDVPVLVGGQGMGKSTLVRWLAINDRYFGEVTEIDGQRGIEQLGGAWICEIAELLAVTKTKEQEAVKAYITKKSDKYRKPYDKQVSELPRRCIFVGTTNNFQFLKDKTGNRRWYPVEVNSSGYWLFDHEAECRAYILQCWAEAKVRFDKGELPNYADQSLAADYIAAQNEAMEDDWRVGAIGKYLDSKGPGELVCARELALKALAIGGQIAQNPTQKESQEIGQIMRTYFSDWSMADRQYLPEWGRQRCWKKSGKPVELPL